MFKRLILSLFLAVTLTSASQAQSAAASVWRSLADNYLSTATDLALKTQQSATAANSTAAQYAYFYCLYSKYYAQVGTDLDNLGLPIVGQIYSYYAFAFGYNAYAWGYQAYLNSAAPNIGDAYYSYLYSYLGYLYSYLAYQYR